MVAACFACLWRFGSRHFLHVELTSPGPTLLKTLTLRVLAFHNLVETPCYFLITAEDDL